MMHFSRGIKLNMQEINEFNWYVIMELIEWLQQISILNIFILKCQVLLRFEITEILNFECEKEHLKYIRRPIYPKRFVKWSMFFHQNKDFTSDFYQKKYGRLEQHICWENEYAKCFMWHILALVSNF